MGCGPQGTWLLHKLGSIPTFEMSDEQLHQLVEADQIRRTKERVQGRTRKVLEEQDPLDPQPKVGRPRTKSRVKNTEPPQTLEGYGVAPAICAKLRATGKPDWQLILELQGAGIL